MASGVKKHEDLHGNVPDFCSVALVLVDVINDLDFPDNELLLKNVVGLGRRIAALKNRCAELRIPALYVNDNWGKWRSDFSVVLAHALRPSAPGRRLAEQLVPDVGDYRILKPKHAAFFATPLDLILSYLQAKTVILVGLTTNACILQTASEIYIRDLKLCVPRDCVVALSGAEQRSALKLLKASFDADTTSANRLDLRRLLRG